MVKFVDMKRTDEEKNADYGGTAMPSSDLPDYPSGLCLYLTDDDCKKLDLDDDCAVGDFIDIRAFAKVTNVSAREEGGVTKRRIELQVTNMALESEDDDEIAKPMKRASRYK